MYESNNSKHIVIESQDGERISPLKEMKIKKVIDFKYNKYGVGMWIETEEYCIYVNKEEYGYYHESTIDDFREFFKDKIESNQRYIKLPECPYKKTQ